MIDLQLLLYDLLRLCYTIFANVPFYACYQNDGIFFPFSAKRANLSIIIFCHKMLNK